MEKIFYKKRKKYKYFLDRPYEIYIEIKPDNGVVTPYIELSSEGRLTVKSPYAWDGPSGPTIDTKSFMRGSLVHDALYQLMREREIDLKHREYADDLLRKLCLKDGMNKFRAWYVHKLVRKFGASSATPDADLIVAP